MMKRHRKTGCHTSLHSAGSMWHRKILGNCEEWLKEAITTNMDKDAGVKATITAWLQPLKKVKVWE